MTDLLSVYLSDQSPKYTQKHFRGLYPKYVFSLVDTLLISPRIAIIITQIMQLSTRFLCMIMLFS